MVAVYESCLKLVQKLRFSRFWLFMEPPSC
jgi:hypothetical protein